MKNTTPTISASLMQRFQKALAGKTNTSNDNETQYTRALNDTNTSLDNVDDPQEIAKIIRIRGTLYKDRYDTADYDVLREHNEKTIESLYAKLLMKKEFSLAFSLSNQAWRCKEAITALSISEFKEVLKIEKERTAILEKMRMWDFNTKEQVKALIESGYNIYQNNEECLKVYANCDRNDSIEMLEFLINEMNMRVSEKTLKHLKDNGCTKALQIYYNKEFTQA